MPLRKVSPLHESTVFDTLKSIRKMDNKNNEELLDLQVERWPFVGGLVGRHKWSISLEASYIKLARKSLIADNLPLDDNEYVQCCVSKKTR